MVALSLQIQSFWHDITALGCHKAEVLVDEPHGKCFIPPGGTRNLGLSQAWSLTKTSTAHDSSSACHAKFIHNSMFICLVISQSNPVYLFVWENSSEVTVRFDLGCRIATAASQLATCTMYFTDTDILTHTFACQISVFCIKPWDSEHV